MKKLALLAGLAAACLALLWLGPDLPDGVAGLRAQLASVEAWRADNPALAALGFFAVYVAATALSFPLAAWLTLAAGALFGFWGGLVIASFAATIGATLAFLASRHLLRDAVQSRFGARLEAINEGVARDGAFYLFSLRLIPVFPFFAINLLMGLTPIGTWTFYWVSQLGMLAGAAVYVNAGTQLAKITDLSQIASPALLLSFTLLGLFPWIARAALRMLRRRRVYARWSRPGTFDRNLIVIGAGAAGLVSAYIAATVKAKVTLIESHKMGGDCLNYGCVPSKALIRSAKLARQMREADRYGLRPQTPEFSFRAVMARVQAVIAAIEPNDSVARYEGLGVDVRRGHAKLIDPWTVEITAEGGATARLTARAIVLATGAAPVVPPIPGLDAVDPVTSDTLWTRFAGMDSPPERLVVLGGGPIGCELAQAFARLGASVTLIEMADRLMTREDDDVSAAARATLERDGVIVLSGHRAVRCGVASGEKWVEVQSAGQIRRIVLDEMLLALGRAARLEGYGLDALGVETGRTIETNAYLETLYPNIYAAGDAAGPWQFTHTASHQAWFASVNALIAPFWRFRVDDRVIPHATFLDPEIARVGLNEREAKAQGVAYEVTRYGIDELDRAIADSAAEGFVKVLTPPGKDRILGATIIGAHAGDLMAEFVLAMKHGIGLNKILGAIHIYPTMAEATKYAAGAWKRGQVNPRLMDWLARFHRWRRG